MVFLSALFFTALGYILNLYGVFVHDLVESGADPVSFISLQFSGALLAGLFWVRATFVYVHVCG